MVTTKAKQEETKSSEPKAKPAAKKSSAAKAAPGQRSFDDLKAEQGRSDKARMRAAKKKAFEFEKKNNSKIYVYYSGKGWHSVGGNSALIYSYIIRPAAGLEPQLRADSDFYNKFPRGTSSIGDMKFFEKMLKDQGIKLEEKGDDYFIYDLGKELSKRDLDTLADITEEQKKEVNRLVKTTEYVYPEIIEKQRRVATTFYHLLRHLSKDDKDLVINALITESLKTLVDLEMMAIDEEMDAAKTLRRAWIVNERTKFYIMSLMDMSVIEAERVYRIENDLVEVNKLINARIREVKKKES